MKSLSVPAVTALIAAIVSSSVLAQQAPPVRIRGTIEKVDGNTLMVKARDGSSVKVTLAENARRGHASRMVLKVPPATR